MIIVFEDSAMDSHDIRARLIRCFKRILVKGTRTKRWVCWCKTARNEPMQEEHKKEGLLSFSKL